MRVCGRIESQRYDLLYLANYKRIDPPTMIVCVTAAYALMTVLLAYNGHRVYLSDGTDQGAGLVR